MNKLITKISICVAVFLGLIVLSTSIVVTAQNEYSIIREFGKIVSVVEEAGISFKKPFFQSVDKLPKQTLLYDLSSSDVITVDKETMISDSYVLWCISDPLTFTQNLTSISGAENRIDNIVYNATKNVISSMSQDELISSRDGELSDLVLANIGTSLDNYGIQIKSFDLKQLDLAENNKQAVYERMISERNNIAATYVAEGQSEAQIIRNTTDMQVTLLLSEAEKEAEILIAEGEAEYMKTLEAAYADPSRTDFYSFVRSLDALKVSMTGEKTIMLSPESPIAQIFYK